MKNQLISIILFSILCCLASCSKYEEGRFTFHSAKNRICQNWKLYAPYGSAVRLDTNYTIYYNNTAYSPMVNDDINDKKFNHIILIIKKDFTFQFNLDVLIDVFGVFGSYESYAFSGGGTWKFSDHKKKIILTYTPWMKNGYLKNESLFTTETTEEWEILRLEESNLKMKLKYNNLDYILEKQFQ